ncbi:MAG: Holliday junction ATP-dependent DNA helicase RuvA [Candidatus Methanoperedens nitroreducens]|uniref:Holliday junction ATP-dependent DNA helicase RuvA n=1 Tax=Candidatus Methanoperedens nitratireducens TaxID=1392998 RepID=A0A0N8KQ84_9EURY|nr:Holliday junction branch migration protein RuvA [Candidatus Methanoperedens sp. BLZ2]KAB2942679.1 MAG: Holliday junction branch migration protein RuvA [Candidatus Methanoperedens sp.]KPQ41426.1 MAG: Holliday junction ATP-dependent DNA helicase RuvA [Candidatus Methanoperedens sp. BLZ1]MBZ0177471.1 Holliday junction branch migration protein RuvA [Candidatus Methanoperedens nitroreducens]MCX9079167.1 Holliday junction branch migration protein RuvA [Candidatus Methanoperedens sp.]
MISHVYGDIARSGEGFVVVDVGGIGYQVNVTKPILNELTGRKEKVKLYTYLHVREDAHILYGFLNQSDLEMFKLLISVTRVGPQIAMNILSQIKIEELAAAIIHEDEKVLTRISGVGAKNAKRLILELKDKMTKKMEGFTLPATSNVNYDAVSALVSLGFARQSAERAVEAVSGGEQKVETIIKAALLKLKE